MASAALVVGALSAACGEPPVPIGERIRESPELVPLDGCDRLVDRWKANMLEENRTRLLMVMQSSLGDPDGDYANREMETPVAPGGAVPPGAAVAADLGDGRFVTLASGQLVLMSAEGDALERLFALNLPGQPDGLVVAGSRILVAMEGAPAGEPPSVSPWGEDPYGTRGQAHLGLVDIVGDELVFVRTFELSGVLTRLAVEDGTLVVAMTNPPGIVLDVVLTFDEPSIPFTGTTTAFEGSLARNAALLDGADPDSLLPDARTLDPDGTSAPLPLLGDDCAMALMAEDGVGTNLLSVLRLDDDTLVPAFHLLTTLPLVAEGREHLLVVEDAQPLWWHWKNDAYLPATNAHAFPLTSEAPTSARVTGRLQRSRTALTEREVLALLVLEQQFVVEEDAFAGSYGVDELDPWSLAQGAPAPGQLALARFPFAGGVEVMTSFSALDTRAVLHVAGRTALIADRLGGAGVTVDVASGKVAAAASFRGVPVATAAVASDEAEVPLAVTLVPPKDWGRGLDDEQGELIIGPVAADTELEPLVTSLPAGVGVYEVFHQGLRATGAAVADPSGRRLFVPLAAVPSLVPVSARLGVVELAMDRAGGDRLIERATGDDAIEHTAPTDPFLVRWPLGAPALAVLFPTDSALVVLSPGEVSLHARSDLDELDRLSLVP